MSPLNLTLLCSYTQKTTLLKHISRQLFISKKDLCSKSLSSITFQTIQNFSIVFFMLINLNFRAAMIFSAVVSLQYRGRERRGDNITDLPAPVTFGPAEYRSVTSDTRWFFYARPRRYFFTFFRGGGGPSTKKCLALKIDHDPGGHMGSISWHFRCQRIVLKVTEGQ